MTIVPIKIGLVGNDGTGDSLRDAGEKINDNFNALLGLTITVANVKNAPYSAVGNGVTDDTTAIQAALDSGNPVYFPAGTYIISSELTAYSDYQHIFGDAGAQIRQSTTNANVLKIDAKTGVVVDGLRLRAAGSWTGYANGNGILINASTECSVLNCEVSNHLGGGVTIYNSSRCLVSGNRFKASPLAHLASDTAADVMVVYGSVGNIVSHNFMQSGQATGVLVQSVASDNVTDRNIVIGNTIKEAKAYGIAVYRQDDSLPITQYVQGTVVQGNTIETVYGSILNAVTFSYTYGCGIYVQGAEGTVVTGNTVRGAHSGAALISPSSFSETLSPGAIGVGNVTRFVISNNVIENSGFNAIDITDANFVGASTGFATVTGNAIDTAARAGIRIRERGRIKITDNAIDTCGDRGIRIQNTSTQYPDIDVSNNAIRNTTNNGIQVVYAAGPLINNNQSTSSAIHGISVGNSANVMIAHNTVRSHASRGITLESTVTGAEVSGNIVVGTGSSTEGIRLDGMARTSGNRVSGCTTLWAGTFAPTRGVNTGTLVDTATTTETDLVSFTIPADTLVVNGDALKLSAFGTTNNNANTKTLRVYVGAVKVFEQTLTISQVSPWRLEMDLVRRTTNGQRCFVHLVQGGTTSVVRAEVADPNQTETSDIVVRVTGQGTSNADIRALSSFTEFEYAA